MVSMALRPIEAIFVIFNIKLHKTSTLLHFVHHFINRFYSATVTSNRFSRLPHILVLPIRWEISQIFSENIKNI